jgi:hypothetical protein
MSLLIDDLLTSDQRRRANGGGSTSFWRMLRYDCNIPQNQRSCGPHFEGAAREERISLRPSTAHGACAGIVEEGGLLVSLRCPARGVTWNGAGGWLIVSQVRHENFSRTVWITFHCRGTTSIVSVISSPNFDSRDDPQQGQLSGAAITMRSRGRWSGNGSREGRLRWNDWTVRDLAAACSAASSSSAADASSSSS